MGTWIKFGRGAAVVLATAMVGAAGSAAWATGSVFLTGHDPDFHATLGGNNAGAQRINQVAISFVQDPAFNSYYAAGAHKFLFVESSIAPPAGHTVGLNGIIASGYALGTNFDHADASTLSAALNQLGTTYSAIVVASDFGGVLTQAELDILNNRAADIASFVNSGGGLYAMAEHNNGVGLTPQGGWLNFVPTVVATQTLNQNEVGNTVTAFGGTLGLTNADVNGNASHTIFTSFGGMSPVDLDSANNVLSIAGRVNIPSTPAATLLGAGTGLLMLRRRR